MNHIAQICPNKRRLLTATCQHPDVGSQVTSTLSPLAQRNPWAMPTVLSDNQCCNWALYQHPTHALWVMLLTASEVVCTTLYAQVCVTEAAPLHNLYQPDNKSVCRGLTTIGVWLFTQGTCGTEIAKVLGHQPCECKKTGACGED